MWPPTIKGSKKLSTIPNNLPRKQKSKNDNLPIIMEMLVEMRQVSTIQMMKTMQWRKAYKLQYILSKDKIRTYNESANRTSMQTVKS